jgi:hypothetical protein
VESDYVFVVENLLTKELKAAHATRLRFYKDKELNVTSELAQAAEHRYHQLYVVSTILDARYNEQEMFHELLVVCRGFPGEATWKPYSVMAVDVPEMVAKFMESQDDTDNACARCDLFESSHGEVLCVAKDENAADIICRRFPL